MPASPTATNGSAPHTTPVAAITPVSHAPVDVLVIGAGPTGLACAIEVQRAGLSALVLDKGCLCNSIFNYPSHMTFFTTPELLEIGDVPFSSPNPKPTRTEALEYYRKVAQHFRLDLRLYQTVRSVSGADERFEVVAEDRFGRSHCYRARKLIVATGYYDLPNRLGIAGEELPKVQHYYDDPHPFFDLDVCVIGGKNSAAIAALELWRHGARVTLVHRGGEMHRHVKYWILPDINNRIKNGEITAYFHSNVTSIGEDSIVVKTPKETLTLPNDYIFALTGYHPDFSFIESLGIRLRAEDDNTPEHNAETLESNVPGIYLAGVIVAGNRTHEIFIENGRFHGRVIADHLRGLEPGEDAAALQGARNAPRNLE